MIIVSKVPSEKCLKYALIIFSLTSKNKMTYNFIWCKIKLLVYFCKGQYLDCLVRVSLNICIISPIIPEYLNFKSMTSLCKVISFGKMAELINNFPLLPCLQEGASQQVKNEIRSANNWAEQIYLCIRRVLSLVVTEIQAFWTLAVKGTPKRPLYSSTNLRFRHKLDK